ncbi:hypothetical protein E4U14_001268 [Claviceps sp. LM454 group G7]|nr:hypothetical protein E4U14_001268 [Claviceps sp. LM454 group G7]
MTDRTKHKSIVVERDDIETPWDISTYETIKAFTETPCTGGGGTARDFRSTTGTHAVPVIKPDADNISTEGKDIGSEQNEPDFSMASWQLQGHGYGPSAHVARITMDEVLPLARPNFAIVADSLALAAEHVRRCINLPKGDLR